MKEDIHETVEKQMAWVALDDIDRSAVIRMKKQHRVAKADALLAMSKYYRQSLNSTYSARLKGVAQGMIEVCFQFDVFTKEEYECLLNILKSKDF